MTEQTPNYRVGDVVNGHRWNGTTWEPVVPGWGSNPSQGTPQHQIGEVVNGYRWNGTQWEPVPPGWGSNPDPGPRYQIGQVVNGYRWNGAAWEPTAAGWGGTPPQKKPWYQSPLGIGVLVLGALVLVGLAFGTGEESPTTSAQPEQATVASALPSQPAVASEEPVEPAPEAESEQEQGPVAGIGTPVRDGKFEFTVTGVESGVKGIGDQFLNQKAQGEFTLVTIRVENIGEESQMFDGSNVSGRDSKGREVSSDSEAGIYANENTEAFLNEINPGNRVTAVVVFDLPKGEKLVTLDVHDSMFSNGAEINLR